MKFHVLLDQLATLSDLDRCLLLVPSEHPDLDVGFDENVDCLWDAILQLILDCGRSHILQVLLVRVVQVGQGSLFLYHRHIGGLNIVDVFIQSFVGVLFEGFLGHDERPESTQGEVTELTIDVR